jgi:CHAD domain-containing protein
MKMVKILALSALLSAGTMADETLALNMSQMENGLSNVQKGFLYNAPTLIKGGVSEIRKANALFHNVDASKKYLPKEKQHMSNIAFNAAKRIDSASDDLIKALNKKEYSKASQSYSEIVNACTACHAVVRGW